MTLPVPEGLNIPLFPLPGIVLFPGTLLPLRVFEPRYLQLLKDVMASEKLIGMAQLKPSSIPFADSTDSPPPAVYSVLGIGRVIAHEKLGDGTCHIALMGQSRCRISVEIPHQPYRIARVATLHDRLPSQSEEQMQLKLGTADLVKTANALVARTLEDAAAKRFMKALKSNHDAGSISDLLASIYVQDCELRQSLLETVDVLARMRKVLAVVEKLLAKSEPRPPQNRYSHDEICLN